MRERLGSGPRIVRALFAAILALGVPIAIALPTDLNGKVYASGAVVLIAAAGVPQGVLVACGTFTSEAKEFSRGENIQLIDGGELLRKIGALAPEQGQALLKLATAGDFSTPTCPACGIKMSARTSSTEGRKFWGCRN